jgi:diguanylate cyclase (GGDEF)-like protein
VRNHLGFGNAEMTEGSGFLPARTDERSVLVVAGAGVIAVVFHASGVLGPFGDVTLALTGLGALVMAIFGIVRWRPRPAWPWALQVVALVLFLSGGLARTQMGTLGDLSPSRSLVPDLLSLPGYAVLAASVLGLVRLRRAGGLGDLDATLDAFVAGVAALTLAWVFLINPALAEQHVALSLRLLLSCYPAMSVFLVALGARLVFGSGRDRPLSMRLLLVTLLCMLVGDVLFMFVDAGLSSIPDRILDVPYALAYVAVMAALMHPSIREVGRPVLEFDAEPRRGRLAFVAVALCVPAVISLSRTSSGLADRLVLSAIVVLCTLAAAWRMARALRESARATARLVHQATHDALTSLPNRTLVLEHLTRSLAQAGEPNEIALLLLDIDRFKLINESLGHSMGDELLVAVGERLQAVCRPGDLVGRVGGDEFVVVVDRVRDAAHARDVAERIRLALARMFLVRDAEIPVAASIGVSVRRTGDRPNDAEAMFRDADTAMYGAKDAGGDAVVVFDTSMRQRVARRLELERELRHALERGELSVAYQPVVGAVDGRVIGMEALLRWSHPELGSVSPEDFVPIAEDTGAIVDIGAWVIERACRDLARLRAEVPFGGELCVAVNLSVRQLRDAALLDHVARSLLAHGLPASALKLELTESMVMENLPLIGALLVSLRSCGVRISIDDFGTGYSSLASLDRLPVDEVKIDRSFVTGLSADDANTSLVAAVVAIADSLGISTVAEGVEELEQAIRLRDLGCQAAQGFLYSPAVPIGDLPLVLERLGVAGAPKLRVVPSTG